MRKILVPVVTLAMVFVLFCSAGVAFTYDEDAVVIPGGELKMDDLVYADMIIHSIGSKQAPLTFSTPLSSSEWTVNLYKNGLNILHTVGSGKEFELSAIPTSDDDPVDVYISLSAKVPTKVEGTYISVLSIREKGGNTYESPKQPVIGVMHVATKTPTTTPTASPTPTPIVPVSPSFTYTTEATVLPPGDLDVGENVISEMTLNIPIRTKTDLTLFTPLENPEWRCGIYRGSVRINQVVGNTQDIVVPQKYLDFDEPLKVVISLKGVVSKDSAGEVITVMSIKATDGLSYVSHDQYVRNPGAGSVSSAQNVTINATVSATPVSTVKPVDVQQTAIPVSSGQSTSIGGFELIWNWIKSLFGF